MTDHQITVARGVVSRLRAGGTYLLLVRTTHDKKATTGLENAGAELMALNADDEGDHEPEGPSFVGPPVPVPGGYLLMVDTSAMTSAAVRAIPDLLARHLVAAGVEEATVALPPRNNRWLVAFRQREVFYAQLVAQQYFDFSNPAAHRDPRLWRPLLTTAMDWLYHGQGGPARLAVTGADLGTMDSRAHLDAAVSAVLSAGAICDILRICDDGERFLDVQSISQVELGATMVPTEQSPGALVHKMQELAGSFEAVAAHLDWAGVDLNQCYDAEMGTIGMHGPGPWSVGDDPRPRFTWPNVAEWVPGAYWWQILTPEQRAKLPSHVAGAVETPLDGGRVRLTFGNADDWARGSSTRDELRNRAHAALAPALPPVRSRSGT